MSKSAGLKRGLKDISDLFVDTPEAVAESEPLLLEDQVVTIGLYAPQQKAVKNGLSELLAEYMREKDVSLTSLAVSEDIVPASSLSHRYPSVHKAAIDWNDLKSICEKPLMRKAQKQSRQHAILFDAEYQMPHFFPTFIPLLDKWIFIIEPDVDSVMDAYKMIKGTSVLNAHLQYYLLFSGPWQAELSELLYDKFAGMLRRHVQADLTWLGHLDTERYGFEKKCEPQLDSLFLETCYMNSHPGKLALVEYLSSYSGTEKRAAV